MIFFKNIDKYEERRQEAPKMRKSSDRGTKSEPKGTKKWAQGRQKRAKGHQQLAKREPKWAKKEPKVSQHLHKIDMTEKVLKSIVFWEARVQQDRSFLEPFSWKSEEKIDARIDAEKVMKINEKSMRKWSVNFIFFEKCVYRKTYFSKKVNVRRPYVSPSRMRVAEGSSRKRNSDKWEIS